MTRQEVKRNYCVRGQRMREIAKDNEGFIWIIFDKGVVLDLNLEPAMLTRLLYLSTYLNYRNELTYESGKRMEREDAQSLTGLEDTTYKRFLHAIIDQGLYVKDPKTKKYIACDQLFRKGIIKLESSDMCTTRLFIKPMRELYKSVDLREHKVLSYLFQIIPFINTKYNILCSNPDETELEFVDSLNLTDLCNLVSYESHNTPRIRKNLEQLTLYGEPVFNIVRINGRRCIYINPRLYYGGSSYDEARTLGGFDIK